MFEFHYRRDLVISLIRSGKHKLVSEYGVLREENLISCILSKFLYIVHKVRVTQRLRYDFHSTMTVLSETYKGF